MRYKTAVLDIVTQQIQKHNLSTDQRQLSESLWIVMCISNANLTAFF